MEIRPQPQAARLLPSLTDFAFLCPIAVQFFLGGGAPALLLDGDTGWHIRTGEWILAHGLVPRQDLYSFTKAGQPWFAWEWLWDVAAAMLHARWGLAAVVLASTIVLCCTSAILYRLICARGVNPLIAFGVTVYACLVSSLHWLARPHLVSLLLVTVFCLVLEKSLQGRLRLLILLPPLTAIWANIHGGFLAGAGLVGIYAAAELLAVLRGTSCAAAFRRSLPYLLCSAACMLASLANPFGYRLLWHIFGYLTDPFYTQTIGEFMPITFGDFGSLLFEVMMIIAIVGAVESLRRGRISDFILVVAWLHFALRSARHLAIFALVSAPLVGLTVQEWLIALTRAPIAAWLRSAATGFYSAILELTSEPRMERFRLASIAGVAGIAYMLGSANSPPKFHADFSPTEFPVKAVDFLARSGPRERIFSTDRWGGYLIFRTYPTSRVNIDGRSDFYGPAFVRNYLDVMALKPGWRDRLSEYEFDTLVLPSSAPLAEALAATPGWKRVYKDDLAVVFGRT